MKSQRPQDDFLLHRDVAKWAIHSGGDVIIENKLGTYEPEETSHLPDGDFRVVGLALYALGEGFSVEPALKILGLRELSLFDFDEVDIQKIA